MLLPPDGPMHAVLYLVKLTRIMTMWTSLYVADKIWQERYVSKVLIDSAPPPNLIGLVFAAVAIDGLFALVVLTVLVLLQVKNKRSDNAYAIDWDLLRLVALDYALSTAVLASAGIVFAMVAQDRKMFRYGQDGLRGIRATGTLLLCTATVVFLIPFYAIV
jgi:hypothetical protein